MNQNQEQPHLDAIRAQILPIVLAEAAFDGWTAKVLDKAAEQAGLHPGQVELALPGGMLDLIRYWAKQNDIKMLQAWEEAEPEKMRIRDKATFLVRSRIEAIGEENREAAERAAGRLLLPDAAGIAMQLAWASADAMWRAMNDKSTDYNYYTKRAILSAVYASTLSVWLQDDEEKTWSFLDRRISNVMQFEGFKAKMRKRSANWPDPAQILGRLRYGRGRARPRRM
jgi:ubiquinone biosynthesis protein COQ9